MNKILHLMRSTKDERPSEGGIIPVLFKIFGQFGEIVLWNKLWVGTHKKILNFLSLYFAPVWG